ncbi:MAG: hypothetical protein MHM6MM_005504 [Cercozoa sp. M6MM]
MSANFLWSLTECSGANVPATLQSLTAEERGALQEFDRALHELKSESHEDFDDESVRIVCDMPVLERVKFLLGRKLRVDRAVDTALAYVANMRSHNVMADTMDVRETLELVNEYMTVAGEDIGGTVLSAVARHLDPDLLLAKVPQVLLSMQLLFDACLVQSIVTRNTEDDDTERKAMDLRPLRSGVMMAMDAKGAGWSNLSASLEKIFITQFVGKYPMRLRQMILVDPPTLMSIFLRICRPFLPLKLRQRLHRAWTQRSGVADDHEKALEQFLPGKQRVEFFCECSGSLRPVYVPWVIAKRLRLVERGLVDEATMQKWQLRHENALGIYALLI